MNKSLNMTKGTSDFKTFILLKLLAFVTLK